MPLIENSTLFWYRYVDDVIACIKKEDSENVLNIINSINSSIQFTKETEEENISFLDLKICKNVNGTSSFSIYAHRQILTL